jgi:hypothetical protein
MTVDGLSKYSQRNMIDIDECALSPLTALPDIRTTGRGLSREGATRLYSRPMKTRHAHVARAARVTKDEGSTRRVEAGVAVAVVVVRVLRAFGRHGRAVQCHRLSPRPMGVPGGGVRRPERAVDTTVSEDHHKRVVVRMGRRTVGHAEIGFRY